MFSFGVEQVIYPRYWFIHHIMQGCARGNDRVRGVYLGLLLAFAVTAFCGVFRRSLRTYVKHSRIAGGIAGIAAAATAAFCGGMRRERYGKSCWPFAFCLCFYGVLLFFCFAFEEFLLARFLELCVPSPFAFFAETFCVLSAGLRWHAGVLTDLTIVVSFA